MANLSDDQKTQIYHNARENCFNKDIVEYVANPASPGNPMVNPEFQKCVTKEYDKLLRAAGFSQWLNNAGGLNGLLGSVNNIVNQSKGVTIPNSGMNTSLTNTTVPTDTLMSGGSGAVANMQGYPQPYKTSQGSNPIIWGALVVLVILLIIFLVVYFKKSAVQKPA